VHIVQFVLQCTAPCTPYPIYSCLGLFADLLAKGGQLDGLLPLLVALFWFYCCDLFVHMFALSFMLFDECSYIFFLPYGE